MTKRADLIQVFLIPMKMPFILQCEWFPEPNECSLMQLGGAKKELCWCAESLYLFDVMTTHRD